MYEIYQELFRNKGKAKTSTEHTRELRARKKALKDAEASKVLSKVVIEDDMYEVYEELNRNKNKAKTSTERTRRWRARKKALKDSQGIQKLPQIKTKAKTSTERTRECRARKKALKDMQASEDSTKEELVRNKTKAKSGAERTRECRARKKALKDAQGNQKLPQNKTKIKSGAERTRECRAPKRALKYAQTELNINSNSCDYETNMCMSYTNGKYYNKFTEDFIDNACGVDVNNPECGLNCLSHIAMDNTMEPYINDVHNTTSKVCDWDIEEKVQINDIIKREIKSEDEEEEFCIKEELVNTVKEEIAIEDMKHDTEDYKCNKCEFQTTFYSSFVVHIDVCSNIERNVNDNRELS